MEKLKPLAITNVSIFQGRDTKIIQNGVITIEGDKIKEVGSSGSVDIPSDAKVMDGKKRFAIPGLIDAHCHITGHKTVNFLEEPLLTPMGVFYARGIRDLERTLNAGFTSIVDAGGIVGLHLRTAVSEGIVPGPRMFAAGLPLSITFGHGDEHYYPVEYVDVRSTKLDAPLRYLICDGEDECRKAARYALRQVPDFVKVMATGGVLSQRDRPEYRGFTLKELVAIVEEAKAAGRFVHAHAQGKEGIMNSLNAGARVIAHATYLEEDASLLARDKGAVIIPTLSVMNKIITEREKAGVSEVSLKKADEVYKICIENIRKAKKVGIKIATGTDYTGGFFPHGENANELKLFVENLEMSPIEAITSATRIASEATGQSDKIGTLEPGKIADLLLVKGNPTQDINVLTDPMNVEIVIKSGKIVKGIEN